MRTYRLCFLTAHDHLADTAAFSELTDDDAVRRALGLADGRRMELWQGDQRIRRWPAFSSEEI